MPVPPAHVDDPAADLLLRYATALHRAGAPAHRLEGMLDQLAAHLEAPITVFSMPTAVFATLGGGAGLGGRGDRTLLLRVEPGAPHLGRQAELDAVAEALLAGRSTPAEVLRALHDIEATPSPWPPVADVLAFAITGAGAATVLGGGPHEAAAGALAGTGVGLLGPLLGTRQGLQPLFEPLATALAMAVALLVHHLVTPIDVVLTTLGAVIVLLPGLALTTAITELATRNLVSGTARLSGALLTFLAMAVGAALAVPLGGVLPAAAATEPPAFAPWVGWAVLPALGLTLAVLLRARPADVGWVVLAPGIAVGCAQLGESVLGPLLGTGAAGFGLALVANLVARIRRRPASTLLVPGILLLVPGSRGLRAVLELVEHHVVSGIDGVFAAVLVATSLSVGVLMANVVVAPRRAL